MLFRSGVRSPGLRACCDLLLAASIIAILVPRYVRPVCLSNSYCTMLNEPSSWIFLSNRHDSWWHKSESLIILATYGTTPMLLNLYVPLSGSSTKKYSKILTHLPRTLHMFATLHTICTKVHISSQTGSCPNCHHNILRVPRSAADPESGDKNTVRTDVRFYDAEERVSSEFQTSGFNTPRQSEETLASSTRTAGN